MALGRVLLALCLAPLVPGQDSARPAPPASRGYVAVRAGERHVLVATASHCHGLATSLTVRPRR